MKHIVLQAVLCIVFDKVPYMWANGNKAIANCTVSYMNKVPCKQNNKEPTHAKNTVPYEHVIRNTLF